MQQESPAEVFAFQLPDPFTRRWYRARWKATRAEIAERGGRVIEGTGELRSAQGGTAGHVLRGPEG